MDNQAAREPSKMGSKKEKLARKSSEKPQAAAPQMVAETAKKNRGGGERRSTELSGEVPRRGAWTTHERGARKMNRTRGEVARRRGDGPPHFGTETRENRTRVER